MTREEALKEIDDKLDRLSLYHSENRDRQIREIDGATYRALIYSKELIERIYDQFEATIEAQEIIIKDKSAIIEAMAQNKTCDGCEYEDRHKELKPCINCILSHDQRNCYEPKAQP